ncbi:TIR domain-containing protein [Salipiger thiooxidans]|uniref:TIR domain-containing protein n=1 Tax=Salipiger thiooxidans TaxID=282683 RepID=UPI001CD36008|nr:nucleotide-binding protein [Salipiger thiooxidans]MCA0849657.1 nucleotide-binding protein [Salipiger thiooxidans]
MSISSALEELNNALLDLQQSDYNTYERPVRKMAAALEDPDLVAINESLKARVDFDAFVANSNQGGSMVGSGQLQWPLDKELEFGLTLELIERAGRDPSWFEDFSSHWYYDGNKIVAGIRKINKSVLIPFARDYRNYLANRAPTTSLRRGSDDRSKVFVVHGHDEGPRESVARFLEKLGLEPIILHEQASRGMTIPEKLVAHSDVNFAVVLLTPDDLGRSVAGEQLAPRARQNVILELGYFVGRLGRDKVCALMKDGVEVPSDFVGTVYIKWDSGSSWKMELARELRAAGYEVDLNTI